MRFTPQAFLYDACQVRQLLELDVAYLALGVGELCQELFPQPGVDGGVSDDVVGRHRHCIPGRVGGRGADGKRLLSHLVDCRLAVARRGELRIEQVVEESALPRLIAAFDTLLDILDGTPSLLQTES